MAGSTMKCNTTKLKVYKKRTGAHERRGSIINRTSIHESPSEIDGRARLGDFEGDTVVGAKRKGALLTLVDRKSLQSISVYVRLGLRRSLSTRMAQFSEQGTKIQMA